MRFIRPILLVAAVAVAFVGAACDGGDKPADDGDATPGATRTADRGEDSDLSQYEDELREAAQGAIKAVFSGDAAGAYEYLSEDYRDRCTLAQFTTTIAFVEAFFPGADEDDVTTEIREIRYEGDRAYVDLDLQIDGQDDEDLEPSSDSDYWVREDGEWRLGTDDDEPCDLVAGDPTSTPASGPGSSRSEPVEPGDSVRIDDLEVAVVGVNLSAADVIEGQDFGEPPRPGNRYVLIRVRARHAGSGDETVSISTTEFKLTGSRNILYEAYGDESSCGFVEDEIDGEMFAGGSVEGFVCFQVPEDERDLILVLDTFFSFGSDGRRFLALE